MPDGRLVFLTGATGYIGSRLARRLAERGDRLRCLVRDRSDTTELERLGAELVDCDLTDAGALVGALDGVDVAYHLAAAYQVGVVNRRALERTNVHGTRAFLSAVGRARTPRAIYVSTTAALAPVAIGEGDETTDYPPGATYPSVYHATKAKAHKLAREAQRTGLPLVVVCPALVYGPGDHSPMARYVEDLIAGRLPGLLTKDPWFSYVHVDDVVEGLLLADEKGTAGRAYILSGEHASLEDFLRRVAEIAGKRLPRLRFPVGLARATGVALDLVSRATGLRFPISREAVNVAAGHRWLHSNARAREELGWSPRPLADGLPEYVNWFVERRARGRNS
ncbi:MAG TPA: NAD-dependent epimerase/dehydratase family protein [Longimicrobiales bacterium]